MTEQSGTQGFEEGAEADLPDPGANREPAEGGRDEVADVPGADTAANEPGEEDDQDHP